MLLRFLPVAKDLAQNESDLVDRLSFLKSLFHVHARHSKVPENVSYEVAAFTQSHASAFAALSYKLDKTWVVDPTNSRFRAATAAMPSSGRLCYSKLVNPFVKAGERDAQTVLKVASSVSQMASLDLWPKHILPIAVPVLCRELFHGSKQTAETKHHLSMLIMEASVLECYHLAYLKTPETRRMQATQPVTRKLFWNAAFFYSELHTMWEQHIGTPEFDDIVRQHVQKTHEVRTRIVTGLIQIPENIVARTKIMQQLERRLLSTHTDDHAAREALHQKRTEVAALDVCVLRTEYEDIHSVLDGANRLIAFLEMEGPFIPMTRVTDTPTSTPPSVERQPTTTQQIDDIIDGMSQLFNPTTDTTGFWAAHLDEEEPKKKRRSRRSRRTKAQTATEEDDSPAEEEEIQPARDDDAEELIRQQQSLVAVSCCVMIVRPIPRLTYFAGGQPCGARGRAQRDQGAHRRRPRCGHHHNPWVGNPAGAHDRVFHVPLANRLRRRQRRPLPHLLHGGLLRVRPMRRRTRRHAHGNCRSPCGATGRNHATPGPWSQSTVNVREE